MANAQVTVLTIFGTRPEAIKMAPVVKALESHQGFKSVVCVTGQHREMLDQVLELFTITPDFNLKLMKDKQDIFDIMTGALTGIKGVLDEVKPQIVLVHGDTSTALAGAMAAFFKKIPVGHVEAGLRTRNKFSPFPEEMNRTLIGHLGDLHFAPTPKAAANLAKEAIPAADSFVLGNTVIDALKYISSKKFDYPHLSKLWTGADGQEKPMILLTIHRRENLGQHLTDILSAVKAYAADHPQYHIVFPVHLNPVIRQTAKEILGSLTNVSLIDPVNYAELCFVLEKSNFVVTDSGGLQEEATAFNKPVLVVRDTTERPEAIDAGIAKLVGKEYDPILKAMTELSDPRLDVYASMSASKNPFGDGQTSQRILRIIGERFLSAEQAKAANIDELPAPDSFLATLKS